MQLWRPGAALSFPVPDGRAVQRTNGVLLFPDDAEVYVGPFLPALASPPRAKFRGRAAWLGGRRKQRGPRPEDFTASTSGSDEGDGSPRKRTGSIESANGGCGSPRRRGALPWERRSTQSREGWGLHLVRGERYEGEWRGDVRHGFGCASARGGERYFGCYADGRKHGRGVALGANGCLHAERYDTGQLMSRELLFPAVAEAPVASSPNWPADAVGDYSGGSCSSTSGATKGERSPDIERLSADPAAIAPSLSLLGISRRNGKEHAEASSAPSVAATPADATTARGSKADVAAFRGWSQEDVARFLCACGLPSALSDVLRTWHVDGAALATVATRVVASYGVWRGVEAAVGGAEPRRAMQRFLGIAVKAFLRTEDRLASALQQPSVESLAERFADFAVRRKDLDIGEIIGEGGFGFVHKARWACADVAVKAYSAAARGGRKDALRNFLCELKVLSRLRHPNILLLLGVSMESDCLLVLEYLSGGSLFDLLHGRAEVTLFGRPAPADWSFSRLVNIARSVSMGMVYLHIKNVIHCDLKSANVLLSGRQEAKICDFGLARAAFAPEDFEDGSPTAGAPVISPSDDLGAARDVGLAAVTGAVGTVNWMAPEVLRGARCSKASDVYSFGMILLEMVTLQVPLVDCNPMEVIGIVGHGRWRPHIPRCPEALETVLRMALRIHPRRRRTFKDICDELHSICDLVLTEVESNLLTFFEG
eukprot:TRINITY_DN55476_c0_g1_i1.p1 TRINITY_DN55476_c0_g1~~TRINITY_DN55476_c0_g1_i1.p1  ORF type:complete len:712 (-),score=141.70 TRINITY_DN55476_c0_g1_i1:31-2166(-)